MAKLLVQAHTKAWEVELRVDETLIGRELDSTVRIGDQGISRHHCMILRSNAGYEILDLDSTNGVLLNDRRIRSSPLRNGDRISLGHVQIVFSDPPGDRATMAAPVPPFHARSESGSSNGQSSEGCPREGKDLGLVGWTQAMPVEAQHSAAVQSTTSPWGLNTEEIFSGVLAELGEPKSKPIATILSPLAPRPAEAVEGIFGELFPGQRDLTQASNAIGTTPKSDAQKSEPIATGLSLLPLRPGEAIEGISGKPSSGQREFSDDFSEPEIIPKPPIDVLLGDTNESHQYGIMGDVTGRVIALDLNHTHTISLFGVQGGGKSYTLGSVVEMASLPIPGINCLPQPLATVIFHYSPTMDYAPEFLSMATPNIEATQAALLKERYGAEPKALADVLLVVPKDKLSQRQAEYPNIEVRALRFVEAELQASHWRILMGATGNQSTYLRQINRIMKELRDVLSLEVLWKNIKTSGMPKAMRELALGRLRLAAEYIGGDTPMGDVLRPGRLVVVDLRDEFLEKDEAMGLFLVLLQVFADVTIEGQKFGSSGNSGEG